jgi:21S rRNA (GM2251-2'-O)-methyltransferase
MRKNEILSGGFSVLNALVAGKRRISKVFVSDTMQSEKILLDRILQVAGENGVSVERKSQKFIDNKCKTDNNQGIIAIASQLEIDALKGLGAVYDNSYQGIINTNLFTKNFNTQGKRPLWIGLEEIVDPRNLGGILRSCYFFGVDGVVLTTRNSAPINETVSKTSAGALEVMDVYMSYNLAKFLKVSKENGWKIYGTDLAKGRDIASINQDIKNNQASIIVFGNEGEGLSGGISKICDDHLVIQGRQSSKQFVDSLNVGVSAGILMHEFIKSSR